MLWETFQHLAPLPPITSQQRTLIDAFFEADQRVGALADALGEDVFDVILQLQSPVVATWISAIITLNNNERRNRALRSLDLALTESHNPSAVRRAASRILRHLEMSRPRTATRDITNEISETNHRAKKCQSMTDSDRGKQHEPAQSSVCESHFNPSAFTVPPVPKVAPQPTHAFASNTALCENASEQDRFTGSVSNAHVLSDEVLLKGQRSGLNKPQCSEVDRNVKRNSVDQTVHNTDDAASLPMRWKRVRLDLMTRICFDSCRCNLHPRACEDPEVVSANNSLLEQHKIAAIHAMSVTAMRKFDFSKDGFVFDPCDIASFLLVFSEDVAHCVECERNL